MSLLNSGCSLLPFGRKKEPEIRTITVTQIEYPKIAIQPHPAPIELSEVEWYVVTPDTLEEFLEKFEKDNGQIVFVAASIRSYENMSVNIQELRRYILQQKQLLLYYEKSVDFSEQTKKEIIE